MLGKIRRPRWSRAGACRMCACHPCMCFLLHPASAIQHMPINHSAAAPAQARATAQHTWRGMHAHSHACVLAGRRCRCRLVPLCERVAWLAACVTLPRSLTDAPH
jgi:hypothetical protein